MVRKLSDDQINIIIDEYGSGPNKFMSDFAKRFGVHVDTIKRVLVENDIGIIPTKDIMSKYHSKCDNHDYFSCIDDEHKAYWLGFLAADGHLVGNDKNKIQRIQFTLEEKDSDMVELMAVDFGIDVNSVKHKIRHQGGKDYYTAALCFNSKEMCSDLIDLGMFEWKKNDDPSLLYKIPDHLERHFVRGVFDGDGSIQVRQRSDRPSVNHYIRISNYGYHTLSAIEDVIVKGVGCNRNGCKKSSTDNNYYIRWGGKKQVGKIAKWIYSDATVYMNRKKILFPDHINIRCGGMSNDEKYNHNNWKDVFDNANECYQWLSQYGFHCPHYEVSVDDIVFDIDDKLNANVNRPKMVEIIKHFSPHYWYSTHNGYNSISEAWGVGNNSVLRLAVDKIWGKKVVNIHTLILAISRHFKDFATVSVFKPWVARHVYETLLPGGGVVVDPCMGWGGRLIGTIDMNIDYVGYDLNQNAVDSHANLRDFLGDKVGSTSFYVADSSVIDFCDGDLLFTSPPYDNTELYYGVDSINTKSLVIYENIFSKFRNTVALNIPLRHVDQCVGVASNYGFLVVDEFKMKTSSFMGREKTYEPILVFERK